MSARIGQEKCGHLEGRIATTRILFNDLVGEMYDVNIDECVGSGLET